MKLTILVQDLKQGDFIVNLGHVARINIFADLQANTNSAKGQAKTRRFDRAGYATQVQFEQDVQYRPANTGKVVVTLVGGTIKNYELDDAVEIWKIQPTNYLAA
jgi:hypothetical protein